MSNYTLIKTDKKNNRHYVIHKLSGVKHSSKPIPYYLARAQLRALNSIHNNKALSKYDDDGAGFLDSLKSAAKSVYGRLKGFVTGERNDFQPKIRKILENIKDNKVVKITVYREPIVKAVGMLANAVSNGELSKFKKEMSIDDMFHLYCIVKLDNGDLYRVEKNSEIDIEKVSKLSGASSFEVELDNFNKSLPEMLQDDLLKLKSEKGDKEGTKQFFEYSGYQYNCQDFIFNLLKNNGLYSEQMKSFVVQDLTKLSKNMSSTSKKVMNAITNLDKRVKILTFGAGLKKVK